MSSGRLASAVNCIDGRTLPVIDYAQQGFHVDYVDMITEPGPIRIISEQRDRPTVHSIRRILGI